MCTILWKWDKAHVSLERRMDNETIHTVKIGSIHFSISHGRPESNQRCRLRGHVTSDLWWGCQLVVGAATSGRAAALYVLAWLKHKHTLLTQCQPVWGREGRAQGGCRRPESRWRLRRQSMTETDTAHVHRQENSCCINAAHIYGYVHKCKQTYTNTFTHSRWGQRTLSALPECC